MTASRAEARENRAAPGEAERGRASDGELLRAALVRSQGSADGRGEPAVIDEGNGELANADIAADEESELEPSRAATPLDRFREAVHARAEALLSTYDQDALTQASDPSWSTPTLRGAGRDPWSDSGCPNSRGALRG